MTNKLKTITDKTITTLIKEEVVLPSLYFDTFQQNALQEKIENTETLSFEIDGLLSDELNKINELHSKTLTNIENFIECTSEAKEAIKEQNIEKIDTLQEHVKLLESNMLEILDDVYRDELTKIYNKSNYSAPFNLKHRFPTYNISNSFKLI